MKKLMKTLNMKSKIYIFVDIFCALTIKKKDNLSNFHHLQNDHFFGLLSQHLPLFARVSQTAHIFGPFIEKDVIHELFNLFPASWLAFLRPSLV